ALPIYDPLRPSERRRPSGCFISGMALSLMDVSHSSGLLGRGRRRVAPPQPHLAERWERLPPFSFRSSSTPMSRTPKSAHRPVPSKPLSASTRIQKYWSGEYRGDGL